MKKWEYTSIEIYPSSGHVLKVNDVEQTPLSKDIFGAEYEKYLVILNKLGKDGWEAFSVSPGESRFEGKIERIIVFLKRQLQEKQI